MNSRGVVEISGYYMTWWGYIIFVVSTFVMVMGVFTLSAPEATAPEAFVGPDAIIFQTMLSTPYGGGALGNAILDRYAKSGSSVQAYQDLHAEIDNIVRTTHEKVFWRMEIRDLKGTNRLLKLDSERMVEAKGAQFKDFTKPKPIPYAYLLTSVEEYPVVNLSLWVVPLP